MVVTMAKVIFSDRDETVMWVKEVKGREGNAIMLT
jgi:hypothetical protein